MTVLPSREGTEQYQAPPQSQPPTTNDENGGHVVQPPANGSVLEGGSTSDSSSSSSAEEVPQEAAFEGDGGDGQVLVGEDAAPMSAKFKKLMVIDIPPMSFGDGLVLKDIELLKIPTIIPSDNPNVMDACVRVLRETLFDNSDPASDLRAEFLPCKFHGSLAVLFAKFKKVKRKENFEFDLALISEITTRSKATGRVWLSHIESLLSPPSQEPHHHCPLPVQAESVCR